MAFQREIKPGDEISSAWWPESVEASDATQISNITSTSFTPGSPEVGVQFTSARTGRAAVCVSAGMFEQSAGDRLFVSFEVYEGEDATGTLVASANVGFGISTHGDTTAGGSSEMVHGNMAMVENLTPGVTHYARMVHAVDGGTTNDVRQRRITVIPMP